MFALLLVISLIGLLLLAVSVTKLRNSGEKFMFTYAWSGILGAFVWEDVVVLSGFYVLASLLTILVKDIRVGLLLLCSFWVVRAAGEALYMFLQQFHRPSHAPHYLEELFGPLRKIFGNITIQKCFIVMQVFWQVICTAAIAALVLLVLHWRDIPAWR